MSPSFLGKMLCYTCRAFTTTLASSAFICADSAVVVEFGKAGCCSACSTCYNHIRIRQMLAEDARVMVKALHV